MLFTPERPQNGTVGWIPDRDFFRIDAQLENGHQRRLIFADGHAILHFVFEQVAKFAGLAHGGPGFEGLGHHGGVRTRRGCGQGGPIRSTAGPSSNSGADAHATAADDPSDDSSMHTARDSTDHPGRYPAGRRKLTVHGVRLLFHRRFVCLRRNHRIFRQRHHWASRVVGLRQFLHEGLRRARDQRQFHILPVFPNRVIDDGPSLQQRLALAGNHNSVRALPDRHFADVAHQQVPFALPSGGDGHAPDVLIARRGDDAQILADFVVHVFFRDANAGGGRQIEDPYFAAVTDDGNLCQGDFLVALSRNFPVFNAQQTPRSALGAVPHLHAGPTQCVEKLRRGRIFTDWQTQRAQAPLQRSRRIVANPGDASLPQIKHSQRLQYVVQLGGGEVNIDVLAIADMPCVFEVTDAVFVENDASHGKASSRIRRGGSLAEGKLDRSDCDKRQPQHYGFSGTHSSSVRLGLLGHGPYLGIDT